MGFQFHRKLFHPYNGSIDANTTMGCRTNCSPITSPLHSPVSLPHAAIPLLSSSLSDDDHMDQNYFLHVVMISIASTVGLVMLFFTISKIIRHFYSRRHYISRINPPILFDIRGESPFSDDEGPAIGHHIWSIPTIGLQQSTIDSITAFRYRRDEGMIEGTECLVCLGEFHEDESLRLLPKCTHCFHVTCIDTWLRSHNNCPLCRAPIIVHDVGSTSNSGGGGGSGSGSGIEMVRTIEHDSISSLSGQNEDTQIENSGGGAQSLREVEISGGWVGDDSGVFCSEDGIGGDSLITPDKILPSFDYRNCHSPISIGSVSSAREFEEETLPMMRLVSVDSSCDSMIIHGVVDSHSDVESSDTNSDDDKVSSSKDVATAKQGRESSTNHKAASIGRALQQRHFSLRRSISQSRKFKFCRRCRSQSSTLNLVN